MLSKSFVNARLISEVQGDFEQQFFGFQIKPALIFFYS